MSYEAIYEVTRTLRMFLHSQLLLHSASAVVTLLPPGDDLPESSGVNLYLYRVTESPFMRNEPWRGNRVTPPYQRPALAITLSYLLTPLAARPADDAHTQGDDAHTMLGSAMLALNQHPVLNRIHLPEFDADLVLSESLRASFEELKVTLSPISLDDLSKIWATINQPYRLSVAYDVSLVEITPELPPALNAGIVTHVGLDVATLSSPDVRALTPASGALASLSGNTVTGQPLRIEGAGLSFPGRRPVVEVGGRPAEVRSTPPPSEDALTVDLPADVEGGPQVDVRVRLGGLSSESVSFTVTPWLSRISPLRTALDPSVNGDLTLSLTGNGFTTTPHGVRLEQPDTTTAPVTIAVQPGGTDGSAGANLPTALRSGLYRVRMVLPDGSLSNARAFQIIPRISHQVSVATVNVSGNIVHRLTLDGARLAGAEVHLVLDDRQVQAIGEHTDAAQIIHTLGRELNAGRHRVAVSVDGSLSRTVEFEV